MQNYNRCFIQNLSTFLLQNRKVANNHSNIRPAMLFLKHDIKTRIDQLVPDLQSRIQEQIWKDVYKFQHRKIDVIDYMAERDYQTVDSKWKFDRIVNQDSALHFLFKEH